MMHSHIAHYYPCEKRYRTFVYVGGRTVQEAPGAVGSVDRASRGIHVIWRDGRVMWSLFRDVRLRSFAPRPVSAPSAENDKDNHNHTNNCQTADHASGDGA